MGDWIKARHRTKNLNLVKQVIYVLKQWSENTGRRIKVMQLKGYSVDSSNKDTTVKDRRESYIFEEDKRFVQASQKPVKSVEYYIEFEILPRKNEYFGLGWHKRDGWYILNAGRKMYPGIKQSEIIPSVITVVGVLEYIKKHYMPDLKIDDQFNFYVNYEEKTDSAKEHDRLCSSGYFEYLRQPDGSFKDYKAEYLKLKNHDIENILKSIKVYNQITSFISSELVKKGFNKKNIHKTGDLIMKKFFPPAEGKGIIREYVPSGNSMIINFHNNIDEILVQKERKRIIKQLPKRPVYERRWILRKDGYRQRYTKRIGWKG